MIDYRIAATAAEREALFRFRYQVYVEELGRYRAKADHTRRMLVDEEDANSWNFYAWDGTRVVASNRLTWGPHGFTARQIEQYRLEPFLAALPADALMVGERTMVAREHRGTDLIVDFSNNMPVPIPIEQISVTFGVCEPHLLSFYASLGQIPYADRNIGSDDAGYLVPIVSFSAGVPTCVQHLVDGHCAVTSPILVGDDAYWREVSRFVPMLVRRGLFEGLATHELQRCIERSNVIDCEPGDRVVKRDSPSHNMYVVLSGALEARDGNEVRGRILPGDIFGETAFVLECNRTLDVHVTAPGTRILSLSDRTLRRETADDSPLAARLLRNLSKALCRRAVAGDA